MSQDAGLDRARGALWGLALGDALGMPTQSLSPTVIAEDYGGEITGLVGAGPRQRIAAGMPAGSVTDDTEQAVLLGQLLVDGDGILDEFEFSRRLLGWQQQMRDRGSLDLLGPSTNAALLQLQQGVPPEQAGRNGTTNGAAMRIAPVGIATGLGSPSGSRVTAVVSAAIGASRLTHNTSLGLGAAAAVAAAVSAGIDGATRSESIELATVAAAEAEHQSPWVAGGSIAGRLRWAVGYLTGHPPREQQTALSEVIGTSLAAQESVVGALAVVAVNKDESPWRILCRLAGAGGDTDTMAAIAGAVLGAVHGLEGWPVTVCSTVASVNHLDLDGLARSLLALRRRPPSDRPTARKHRIVSTEP